MSSLVWQASCSRHLHAAVKWSDQITGQSSTPNDTILHDFGVIIIKIFAVMWESIPQNMSQAYVRRARCSTDALAAGGRQTAKTRSVLTLKLQCDTGLPAASLLPLQHAVRLGTISSPPLIPTQDMMTGSICHCHTHNRCLVFVFVSIPRPRGLLSETRFLPRARRSWCWERKWPAGRERNIKHLSTVSPSDR